MPTDDPVLEAARAWRGGRHIDLLRAGISELDAFDRDLAAFARAQRAAFAEELATFVEGLKEWSRCCLRDVDTGTCAHSNPFDCFAANLRRRAEEERSRD